MCSHQLTTLKLIAEEYLTRLERHNFDVHAANGEGTGVLSMQVRMMWHWATGKY